MVKKGDRVRIKNFAKKFNGGLATVDSVDGYYVNVFPDSQPENKTYPLELLDNEVELVQDQPQHYVEYVGTGSDTWNN